MPEYQGREITATLQAPTGRQLNWMISSLNEYARYNHLDKVRVLSRGKDPDGGYKAIIEAHNFNPMQAIRDKWAMRPSSEEKLIVARRKITIKEEKESIAEREHKIEMRKLQRKEAKAREKKSIAQTKLETAKIKEQRREVKGRSGAGSLLTNFIKSDPRRLAPRRNKPNKPKRHKPTSDPRIVTLRM